jgi:CBS domain-containing protein
VDSVANAAYLLGLTLGLVGEYGDVSARMAFHDCQANFHNAASTGLRAALPWLDGSTRTADELVLLTLPLAAQGLKSAGISQADTNRYLDLVGERATRGQTGARWLLDSYNRLRTVVPQDEALQSLVQAYLERQRGGTPVHTWSAVAKPDRSRRRAAYQKVSQVMTTDLITAQEDSTLTLAEALMRWERIRHIPVENDEGRLVGLFTLLDLMRAVSSGGKDLMDIKIGDVMSRNPPTVGPDTPTLEAIRLMDKEGVSALPVVDEGKLLGLLTQSDLMRVAARLLE